MADDRAQTDTAAQSQRNAVALDRAAVVTNDDVVRIAARQTADGGYSGIGGVPGGKPAFRIETQGIGDGQPHVRPVRFHAARRVPKSGAGVFFHLTLRELERLDLRLRQAQQKEGKPRTILGLLACPDQPRTGTPDQERNPSVDAQQFEKIFQKLDVIRRKKDDAATHVRVQFRTGLPGGFDHGFLGKFREHQTGDSAVRHAGKSSRMRGISQREFAVNPAEGSHRKTPVACRLPSA